MMTSCLYLLKTGRFLHRRTSHLNANLYISAKLNEVTKKNYISQIAGEESTW